MHSSLQSATSRGLRMAPLSSPQVLLSALLLLSVFLSAGEARPGAQRSLGTTSAMPAEEVGVEKPDPLGVVRSSPAPPMPSYNRFGAPVPLPEFPTLPPPVVWSFPAAPLPSIVSSPPPQDMPLLPGDRHSPPPPPPLFPTPPPSPCQGEHQHHQDKGLPIGPPPFSSPVPVVAAEPVVSPGSTLAPEIAPEPTAGGAPPTH